MTVKTMSSLYLNVNCKEIVYRQLLFFLFCFGFFFFCFFCLFVFCFFFHFFYERLAPIPREKIENIKLKFYSFLTFKFVSTVFLDIKIHLFSYLVCINFFDKLKPMKGRTC